MTPEAKEHIANVARCYSEWQAAIKDRDQLRSAFGLDAIGLAEGRRPNRPALPLDTDALEKAERRAMETENEYFAAIGMPRPLPPVIGMPHPPA